MNYKRSKYFTTLGKRKIKYLFIKKKSQITIVFFHGFMSDMIGAKPTAIQKFCKKQKLKFFKILNTQATENLLVNLLKEIYLNGQMTQNN